jgi:hypothetical protein
MSQFYVDVGGLNGVYNVLARAAGDASDTLDYTKAHCDLDWNAEGPAHDFDGSARARVREPDRGVGEAA